VIISEHNRVIYVYYVILITLSTYVVNRSFTFNTLVGLGVLFEVELISVNIGHGVPPKELPGASRRVGDDGDVVLVEGDERDLMREGELSRAWIKQH
jgi:hypothetical protein